MAATASFSPIPQAQIQSPPWKKPHKPHKNLHFLCNPTSHSLSNPFLSSFFPLNLKPTSIPLQLHPLSDSVRDNFIENLENSVDFQIPTNQIPQIIPRESRSTIFIQDPPWISPIFLKNLYRRTKEVKLEFREIERTKYNSLRRRQVKAETEAWEKMVEEYRELEREMCERKLAPNLPHMKGLFLGWFEPLREVIEKEQKTQRSKKKKAAFAPHIDLLPADKMAVIVMYKMMALVMAGNEEGCVRVVQAAVQIGMAIENEVRIHNFLEKFKNYQRKKTADDAQEGLIKEKEILRRRVNSLIKRRRLKEVQKLVINEENKPWGRDAQAKLGSRLIELLTETAYVQSPIDQSADCPPDVRPAFTHRFRIVANVPGQKIAKKYGVIECDTLVLSGLDKNAKHMLIPYVPMLIPPRKWKGYDKGGYLFLPSYVMRTHGSWKQQEAVKNVGKGMQKVFEVRAELVFSTYFHILLRSRMKIVASLAVEICWDELQR